MVDRGRGINNSNFIPFYGEVARIDQPVGSRELPKGWVPDKWSVICGRGREPFEHVGNRRLQVLVDCHLGKYERASTKMKKSTIVSSIVEAIRYGSQNGGFVKRNVTTGRWYEVGDSLAREKVGQALREAIAAKNPYKYQTKKIRRKQRAALQKAGGIAAFEMSLLRRELVIDHQLEKELETSSNSSTDGSVAGAASLDDDDLDNIFCNKTV